MNKDKKILIIGLGLIGGSYAIGLTNQGYEVHAITRKQSDIDYAIEKKMIVEGRVEFDKEYISSFNRIIFALYPKIFINWIKTYKSYFSKGTIFTDVTGVKTSIVYKIQDELPDGVEFIGAHPMAGREVYGVKNAKAEIFHKANYIVTPTERNSEEAIKFAETIGRDLKFSRISRLSPEKHDEMIAFLSQLTHCIAVSLMTCKDSEHLATYTGDSFRDLTRIANINEDMWSELFLMNKEQLVKQMDLFLNDFSKLKKSIEDEDVEQIKELMRISTKRRSHFNKE